MNNISKAFNGRIIEARDKPIIIMLDWIRVYWMIRFTKKRAKGLAYKGRVYPKPLKRLEKEIEQFGKWTIKWVGAQKVKVRTYPDKFMVNLQVQHCNYNW